MEKEKATTRLLNAIRNPYTSVLGHLTGRLLLGREGYPLNMEQIFEACSEHSVAIEINAHPYRLDLDWKYVGLAQSMGVKIIINPDAHQINGLKDIRFGLGIARKGGLLNNNCLNFLPTNQLLHWLDNRVKG
jgi:DNA polymerase (family 10)